LATQDPNIIMGAFPYFRNIHNFGFFGKNIILLLPLLFNIYRYNDSQQPKRGFIKDFISFPLTLIPGQLNRNNEFLAQRDIALMTILNGWYQVLKQWARKKDSSIILDEGPICLMAKLTGFGSQRLQKSQYALQWWDSMFNEWAQALNIIVKLETPNLTLMKRIRARRESFEFFELSDKEVIQYLTKINTAQEDVISHLQSRATGIVTLRFNTIQESLELMAEKIIATYSQMAEKVSSNSSF